MATLKAVEVIPVSLPLREPYRIARALQERGEYVVFRLETDEGYLGVGEAAPFHGESEETQGDIVAATRHHLVPAILGVGSPCGAFSSPPRRSGRWSCFC